MVRRSVALPFCVAVLGCLILTTIANAQQSVHSKGIIRGVKPGFIKVTAGGGDWILKVDKNLTKRENILLEGEADPSWLQRGMLVRFEAHLDQQGVADGQIEELTVFTARNGYRVGVMLDQPGVGTASRDSRSRRKSRSRRDRFEEAEVEARDKTSKEVEGDDAGKAALPKSDLPKYLVAGRLDQFKNNKILVTAGRDRVTATLAEGAKIKLDVMGDYRLAQEGDQIDFTARQVKPGQAIAKRLRITLDAPLRGKPPTTVSEKRRRSRPATPRDRAVDAALE